MKIKKWLAIIAAAGLTVLIISFTVIKPALLSKKNDISYEFTAIEKRDIENTVSSSGTLEPVGEISVLAQMTGTVEKTYASFNDQVKKNQKLADLNTELLAIQEKSAEASLMKAKAEYEHSLLEYNNSTKLYEKKMISDFDYHAAKTSLESAKADVISADAALQELQIKINQYALIISPIDGIILSKEIDAGDTVISGSDSTTLFTLAESLSKMEVQASVDELDISRIRKDQDVRFTVDSYPDSTFSGKVREIRLVPETSDNVVSYTVIVDADNSDGKLLPGMTASLEFIAEQKKGVLTVLSQALRFQPSDEEIALANEKMFEKRLSTLPEEEQKAERARREEMQKSRSSSQQASSGNILTGGMRIGGPGMGGQPPGMSKSNSAGSQQKMTDASIKRLWYLADDGELTPFPVTVGVSDGTYSEIEGITEEIENMKVILKVKVN